MHLPDRLRQLRYAAVRRVGALFAGTLRNKLTGGVLRGSRG